MGELNLDTIRAARAEVDQEGHTLTFGGETFDLPPELPAVFLFALPQARYEDAMRALFGAETERFYAQQPSLADIIELINGVGTLYGVTEGESAASPSSSSKNGKRSRPTSKRTTG